MLKPLAVAAVVSALLFATGARSLDGPALIRVTQRTESFKKLTAQSVQSSFIRDRKGRRIGWSVLLCTELEAQDVIGSAATYCAGTFAFPRGRIQTAGIRRSRDDYVLAVIGGTGLYSNTGGSLLVRTTSAPWEPRVELLLFSLET